MTTYTHSPSRFVCFLPYYLYRKRDVSSIAVLVWYKDISHLPSRKMYLFFKSSRKSFAFVGKGEAGLYVRLSIRKAERLWPCFDAPSKYDDNIYIFTEPLRLSPTIYYLTGNVTFHLFKKKQREKVSLPTHFFLGQALDLLVSVSSICYHTSTSDLSTTSSTWGLTCLMQWEILS